MNTIDILKHVPAWVGLIFIALVAYGWRMSVDRVMPLRRTVVVPVLLGLLSLSGVVSSFRGQVLPIAAWMAGLLAVVAVLPGVIDTTRVSYDPTTRRLKVPGSWVPLVLMMALFALKFGVGMALGMHPALGLRTDLSAAVGLLYGAFAGVFLARAMAVWRVVSREATPAGVPSL